MLDFEIFEPMASERGWNEETLLLLVLGFVIGRGLKSALIQYLREVAQEEAEQETWNEGE